MPYLSILSLQVLQAESGLKFSKTFEIRDLDDLDEYVCVYMYVCIYMDG